MQSIYYLNNYLEDDDFLMQQILFSVVKSQHSAQSLQMDMTQLNFPHKKV